MPSVVAADLAYGAGRERRGWPVQGSVTEVCRWYGIDTMGAASAIPWASSPMRLGWASAGGRPWSMAAGSEAAWPRWQLEPRYFRVTQPFADEAGA